MNLQTIERTEISEEIEKMELTQDKFEGMGTTRKLINIVFGTIFRFLGHGVLITGTFGVWGVYLIGRTIWRKSRLKSTT